MEDREKEEGAEKKEMNLERLVKILLTQVINIASSIFLGKLTKIEKNTSITKDMISDISKYFWFNILISISIFIVHNNLCLFSYLEIEKYFYLNKLLMENVLYSVITSHFSYLFFYFWNLLKRFSDSRFNNGSTTEIKKKTKYEKIYLGPEFPFAERYGKILSTLAICFFYGTNCPVIFFFFILFLIVIYIVDKFLMINYYKKPTFYSNFLPKKINNYFFLCIFIYFYGLIYNGSNPYLFDNSSLRQYFFKDQGVYSDIFQIITDMFYFLNPITLFYILFENTLKENFGLSEYSFLYYSFQPAFVLHFFLFLILFVDPVALIKKIFTAKNKFLTFLNTAPVEIGNIYTEEILEKYYTIKKLQLFNLIIDCHKSGKLIEFYSNLVYNYLLEIKYLKMFIDKNKNQNQKIDNIISDKIEDEKSPLIKVEMTKSDLILIGDVSYNQSFIPKYEKYSNYNLIKNL